MNNEIKKLLMNSMYYLFARRFFTICIVNNFSNIAFDHLAVFSLYEFLINLHIKNMNLILKTF